MSTQADGAAAEAEADVVDAAPTCLGIDELRVSGFGWTANTPEFNETIAGLSENERFRLSREAFDREFEAQCRDDAWATDAEAYLAQWADRLEVTSIECRTAVCRVELEGAYTELALETLPNGCGSGSTSSFPDTANGRRVTFVSRCGFHFASRSEDHVDSEAWDTPIPL